MNLQKAQLAAIDCPLTGLAQTITAVNYNVDFKIVQFTFDGPAEMTMEHLKALYPNAPVAGKLIPISFVDAQKIVNRSLSFHVKGSMPYLTTDTDLVMARFLTFWNFVKEEIQLPCSTVLLHVPDYGSYFSFGVVWNFCIILLEDSKGLVLSGNAYD